MSIHVQCSCGKLLKAEAAMAGTSARCPSCGKALVVPSRSPPLASASEQGTTAVEPGGLAPQALEALRSYDIVCGTIDPCPDPPPEAQQFRTEFDIGGAIAGVTAAFLFGVPPAVGALAGGTSMKPVGGPVDRSAERATARKKALEYLRNRGYPVVSPAHMETLMNALRKEDVAGLAVMLKEAQESAVRCGAIAALRDIGRRARPYTETIIGLMNDPDPFVRTRAAQAVEVFWSWPADDREPEEPEESKEPEKAPPLADATGTISFQCSRCQRPFRVSRDLAGRQCRCKSCCASLTIPHPEIRPPESSLPELALVESKASAVEYRLFIVRMPLALKREAALEALRGLCDEKDKDSDHAAAEVTRITRELQDKARVLLRRYPDQQEAERVARQLRSLGVSVAIEQGFEIDCPHCGRRRAITNMSMIGKTVECMACGDSYPVRPGSNAR